MKKAAVVALLTSLVASSNLLACAEDGEDVADAKGAARIEENAPAPEVTNGERNEEPAAPAPALAPLALTKSVQADGTVLVSDGTYDVVLDKKDTSVPDVLVDELLDVYFRVYGKMALRFNASAPRRTRLTLDPGYDGVAYVSGTSMTISSKYILKSPKDVDVVTHEAFHLVQSYEKYSQPGCPAWAAEGFADYARYRYGVKNVSAGWSLPAVTDAQKPTDSYRVTGRFFVWLENRVRASIIADLHTVLNRGKYTSSFWTTETGKSIDALWADYRTSSDISVVEGAACVASQTYCGGHEVFGASDVVYRCNGDRTAIETERCERGCAAAAAAGQDACL